MTTGHLSLVLARAIQRHEELLERWVRDTRAPITQRERTVAEIREELNALKICREKISQSLAKKKEVKP